MVDSVPPDMTSLVFYIAQIFGWMILATCAAVLGWMLKQLHSVQIDYAALKARVDVETRYTRESFGEIRTSLQSISNKLSSAITLASKGDTVK